MSPYALKARMQPISLKAGGKLHIRKLLSGSFRLAKRGNFLKLSRKVTQEEIIALLSGYILILSCYVSASVSK